MNVVKSKLLLSLLGFAAIFTGVFYYSSCKKDLKTGPNENQYPISQYGSSSIDIQTSFSLAPFLDSVENCQDTFTKYGYYHVYEAAVLKMQTSPFQTYIQNLLNLDDNQIVSITFYLNARIDSVSSLSKTNIEGFSLFYQSDNKLFHSLFFRGEGDGNYQQDNSFNLETNLLSPCIAAFLLHIPENFIGCSTYLMTIDRENLDNYLQNAVSSKNEFGLKEAIAIKEYYENYGNEAPVDPPKPKYGPGPNCPESPNKDMYCQEQPWTSPTCEVRGCAVNTSDALLSITPDNSWIYAIKNELAGGCNLGIKYYFYYYAIGDVLCEGLNTTSATTVIGILPTMHEISIMLLNPAEYGEEIPINSEKANDLLDFFDYVRGLYNNDDFRAIIDDVKNDVNRFTGKSVNEILSETN